MIIINFDCITNLLLSITLNIWNSSKISYRVTDVDVWNISSSNFKLICGFNARMKLFVTVFCVTKFPLLVVLSIVQFKRVNV